MGLSFDILIFDCLLKAPQPVTGLFLSIEWNSIRRGGPKPNWHSSVGRAFICGTIDPGFKPHQCLLTSTRERTTQLPCWPQRSAGFAPEVDLGECVR